MTLKNAEETGQDSAALEPLSPPSSRRRPSQKPSRNVLAQRQMVRDIENGSFQPDFVTGLTAPDKPNPFLQAFDNEQREPNGEK